MPKPYTHRPHRLALAIALTLGSIELSMAQQAEPVTVIEAPVKKTSAAPWPKKDDLLAIRNFIGPMSHAVNAAAPEAKSESPPLRYDVNVSPDALQRGADHLLLKCGNIIRVRGTD